MPTMTPEQTKTKTITINEEFCKQCGLCIKFCPDNALAFQKKFNSKGFHPIAWKGDCRFCGMCFIMCPDLVIQIKEKDTDENIA